MRDNDGLLEDPDGSEVADLDAAVNEAKLGARSLMAEDIRLGRALRPISIEISETDGLVLQTVTFRNVLDELTADLYEHQVGRRR
ncbi:conserved hypothetical protein [Pseudorhizobium banfieldiae]|uniref:DUF6894 domain-containing protein n=2 Tax=Pseudorhizobium banfieldiae TaxID=1125847 RepID=L0NCV4_9HYPH|nr:conserved hypothetical protein [Pseudorhizobium banfieldiae]